jgi:hypothetical protein
MTKADRVHSTPRRTAPKIKAKKRRPNSDAVLLKLVARYLAAEAEEDRLNDAVEAMERKPAEHTYLTAAEKKHLSAVALGRALEGEIIDTPAKTIEGIIGKARCVEANLVDGESVVSDPDAQFAVSMAKDLLALRPASGRRKAAA